MMITCSQKQVLLLNRCDFIFLVLLESHIVNIFFLQVHIVNNHCYIIIIKWPSNCYKTSVRFSEGSAFLIASLVYFNYLQLGNLLHSDRNLKLD